MIKHYCFTFIAVLALLAWTLILTPWLISQPDDLLVALGVIGVGACPIFGWLFGGYFFNVVYTRRKK